MSSSTVYPTPDNEVLSFWAQHAYWQRTASDAFADYCESLKNSLSR